MTNEHNPNWEADWEEYSEREWEAYDERLALAGGDHLQMAETASNAWRSSHRVTPKRFSLTFILELVENEANLVDKVAVVKQFRQATGADLRHSLNAVNRIGETITAEVVNAPVSLTAMRSEIIRALTGEMDEATVRRLWLSI